ncbi:hypothetical protein D3C85_1412030 [compost metagenome]
MIGTRWSWQTFCTLTISARLFTKATACGGIGSRADMSQPWCSRTLDEQLNLSPSSAVSSSSSTDGSVLKSKVWIAGPCMQGSPVVFFRAGRRSGTTHPGTGGWSGYILAAWFGLWLCRIEMGLSPGHMTGVLTQNARDGARAFAVHKVYPLC